MSDKQILSLFEPGSYEVVPHDGMRRTIAQRLTASIQNVPHFYLTIDCDIGKLLAAREEINAAAPKDKEKKPLYKISVNDFVIKAMAVALQKIPNCNVNWSEGGMIKHKQSDVGVAVAAAQQPGRVAADVIERQPGENRPVVRGHVVGSRELVPLLDQQPGVRLVPREADQRELAAQQARLQ
jgi:pyruvate dehydrogenase E2 component (dihydrolipoamide acetyltransferase)